MAGAGPQPRRPARRPGLRVGQFAKSGCRGKQRPELRDAERAPPERRGGAALARLAARSELGVDLREQFLKAVRRRLDFTVEHDAQPTADLRLNGAVQRGLAWLGMLNREH